MSRFPATLQHLTCLHYPVCKCTYGDGDDGELNKSVHVHVHIVENAGAFHVCAYCLFVEVDVLLYRVFSYFLV